MNDLILPEKPERAHYSNEGEFAAHKQRVAEISSLLVEPHKHLNEMLKVFTRHASEGGDFSEEGILLHKFINKMGPVRMSLSVGWINAAYLMCVDNVQVYAGDDGVETRHADTFDKMALPFLPSAIFAEMRDVLEPHTIKTPENNPS